jgi:hypothetical protein
LFVVLALSDCPSIGREVPDWHAFAVLQFSMVTLWWLADEWGVPQISKVPTTHLLLGVGLVGVGQVSFCLVQAADTIKQIMISPVCCRPSMSVCTTPLVRKACTMVRSLAARFLGVQASLSVL